MQRFNRDGRVIASLLMLDVMVLGSCGKHCPEDERMRYRPGLTGADICEANGYRLIVRFAEPQPVDTVLALLEPIHASLACDDPATLAGQPGKTCYVIALDDMCCSEGSDYFLGIGSPALSVDRPHPETPCDCLTHWTEI
jgi:hypothetical protein